jgi:uncharacterized protein with ATP-grasp and redox domains
MLPIINDAAKSDAFAIGMDEVAGNINNGDDTPGTVLDGHLQFLEEILIRLI